MSKYRKAQANIIFVTDKAAATREATQTFALRRLGGDSPPPTTTRVWNQARNANRVFFFCLYLFHWGRVTRRTRPVLGPNNNYYMYYIHIVVYSRLAACGILILILQTHGQMRDYKRKCHRLACTAEFWRVYCLSHTLSLCVCECAWPKQACLILRIESLSLYTLWLCSDDGILCVCVCMTQWNLVSHLLIFISFENVVKYRRVYSLYIKPIFFSVTFALYNLLNMREKKNPRSTCIFNFFHFFFIFFIFAQSRCRARRLCF